MRPKHPEDDVIDHDLILVWGKQKRIITGADLLGRLLRGIIESQRSIDLVECSAAVIRGGSLVVRQLSMNAAKDPGIGLLKRPPATSLMKAKTDHEEG